MPIYSNLTFTITAGLSFNTNDFVKVAHDNANYITGRVVSYNPTNGQLIVTPYEVVGGGTYSSWTVTLTGFNGSSGTFGTAGTAGTHGTSASSGTSGTDGSSGTSGTSGTDGSSGTSANDGTAATSGASGSNGTSATSGTAGDFGSSASSGSSGTSGTAGAPGSSGTSATSGSSGTAGSVGSSGSSGTNGSSGVSGTSGSSGATGPIGPLGPLGAVGAQGPAGGNGSSGATGPIGPTGPGGPTGAQGPTGGTGPQGPGGPGGPGGPAGPQGPGGAQGGATSYNQNLNTNGYPVFGNVAMPANATTTNRMYFGNFKQLVNSANQGVGWTGYSDGWYTVGALGAAFFFNTSSRTAKENIIPFAPSAVEILNEVDIVSYNYEVEQNDEDTRIGFIAEDTPTILSGNNNDRMDTVSVIGLALKSIQEIDKRITILENKKNNAS